MAEQQGSASTIANAAIDSLRQVLGPIAQQLAGAVAPPPPPPPPPPPWDNGQPTTGNGGEEGGSIVSAWWFWTIIGAVVAGGAATGIYFGVKGSGSASGPDAPQLILDF